MLDPDTLNKKYSFIGTYKIIVHEKKSREQEEFNMMYVEWKK